MNAARKKKVVTDVVEFGAVAELGRAQSTTTMERVSPKAAGVMAAR